MSVMSKSVSEVLKEQGIVLTDAPNFEGKTKETVNQTRLEKAIDITNQKVSNKCRKAFKKFTSKYNLDIDFEKFEEKSDELMELINKTASDDEDASLVRHMKSYCKFVLKNLSKIPDVVGINGDFCSKEELAEFVNAIEKEAKFSGKEQEVFTTLKDSLISGLFDTMNEINEEVEALRGEERKEWVASRLTANMKKYSDYSEYEIRKFAEGVVSVMDEMDEEDTESEIIPETTTSDDGAKKRAEIEKVMKQLQEEEAKEEADKVSMTPEAKIESAPTASVTKKTTTSRYIEKEPKMTEYRKAGKVNQYFDDLKIWQQQYTA